MSYITLSPGIRCIYSCHSCYMSGPAAPPPPYIVQYSISGALSSTSYWQRDHLVSCFHLVDERTNYQSFHHYLVPLTLCRPEIRTDSPDLQLPVMRGNRSQQTPNWNHTEGQNALSQPCKCIPRNSENLQFNKEVHKLLSAQCLRYGNGWKPPLPHCIFMKGILVTGYGLPFASPARISQSHGRKEWPACVKRLRRVEHDCPGYDAITVFLEDK